MKRFLFIFFVAIVFLSVMATPVFSQTPLSGADSAMLKSNFIPEDNRVEALSAFLEKYNSPLAGYAREFVDAADAYDIDWRLVPAITGVESTFGKQVPKGSFNAYGWNNGAWKFNSWTDSIWYVTGQLRTRYIDNGAISLGQIGPIYAPPSRTWAWKVRYFMNQIEVTNRLALDL